MNKEVVEKALKELKTKVEEVKAVYTELQTLKKYGADIVLPDLQNLLNVNGTEVWDSTDMSIRPDEFFGMTNSEAAEKYLKKIGHAAPFDDIYTALVEGGLKFTANGRTVLNNQLTRGTRKFVKMGKGHKISFGLLDFYPDRIKRQRLGQATEEVNTNNENNNKEENEPEETSEELTDENPF